MGLNQSTQNHENKPQQHQQVSLPQNSKYKYSQQRNQLNSNSASRMKKQDKPDKVNESEIKKNSSSKISDSKIAEGKSQAKMLKVMTLNYSGILLSPFQFYPQAFAKDYNKLSLIFQKLLKKMLDEEGFVYKDPVAKDVKKQFKWSVGTIDKDVQQNRYTPIYNKRVGIRTTKQNQAQKNHHNHHHDHQYEDAPICDCFSHKHHHKQLVQQQQQHQQKRLEAFQQFKQSWQRTFQPHAGKYQKKHIDDMMKFDLLCYKTILRYVYKDQVTKVMSKKEKQPLTFELTDKFIKGLDASLYESFMEEFFNKAFIDDEIKIKKTIKKFFQLQVDVIYLQQTTKAFKQRIKSKQFSDVYYVQECKTGQSLMLVNHRKIAPQLTYQQFKSKIRMLQNVAWNGDSVGIAYEDILFICAHLSSKQEKNTAQKIQMLQRLQQLVQQFKGSTVILGGDINSFIQKVPPGFYIYPERKQERTTKKKRTFLQPQVNKANKDIIQCKDHIISNKPLRRKVVWTIDCQMPGQNMFLPTDDHPYDHFALFAEVQYK